MKTKSEKVRERETKSFRIRINYTVIDYFYLYEAWMATISFTNS